VAFNIEVGGALVLLRLTQLEMQEILSLLDTDWVCTRGHRATKVWWDYESLPPQLQIYRDDHFSIRLPQKSGLDLVEAIRAWLPECVEPF
jgi:hypothetical protein